MITNTSKLQICKWIVFFIAISLFFIISCAVDNNITGTVDETDTGKIKNIAMLYKPDGTPATGAIVKIFNVADTTKNPASEVISDENGNFLVSLVKGTYNVYAEKGELVAFQDSIRVLEDTIIIEDDTLEIPTNLSGVVGIQPNHDPRTVTVQVLGTDIYSNVNDDGYFTLNRMARGDFTLKLSITLEKYTTTFESITITTDTPDTLSDTLWLIYTGIPVVEGIKTEYDTLNGVVRLSWEATNYRDFQDYLVYRDYLDSVTMSVSPIAFTPDTFYVDSIFNKNKSTGSFSFSDTNDYNFKYRVSVRSNSQEVGLPYKYIKALAASPVKVKTEISVVSYHIVKNILTTSASINDSIQFVINLSNQTRALREIKYTELQGDSILRIAAIDSTQQFQDTMYYKWGTIGQKNIEISVIDLTGSLWKDTINFQISSDLPDISLLDTLIYLNVPFTLIGVDSFGSVENLSIDTNRYVQYESISDSIVQVTIRDTLTDNYELRCKIADDDGNQVNKTFTLKTGLQWEKIADNFLGTNKIRSIVELNNTLFAFATSKYARYNCIKENDTLEISLYSSSDAINWSKVMDSVPWSNWFTKPVVHNGQIFFLEGIIDSNDTNKIWFSSNGINWESEKLVNFPKWFPNPSAFTQNYSYFQEMVFTSFKGKLWAGATHFYGDETATEFYNSSNGTEWTSLSDQYSPPESQFSYLASAQYGVSGDMFYYLTQGGGASTGYIYKTGDFITHSKITHFNASCGGSDMLPLPVSFMNRVVICISQESTYCEKTVFIKTSGDFSSPDFPYPGSIYHSCIVFNNRLLSISNNGVYATK